MEINFNWNFKNEEETFKQINILQTALIMACEDLSLYEDVTTAGYKAKCYLKEAEQKLPSLLKKGDK